MIASITWIVVAFTMDVTAIIVGSPILEGD
jgi:hypothetical protein